jgi:hypothetical protein
MATFRGTMKKNSLEGGFWELHTDDGQRYFINGGDAALRREGLRVEIHGKIDKSAFNIGMTGPSLVVQSYKKIEPK